MTTGIMKVESLIIVSSKKAMPAVAPRSHAFGPLALRPLGNLLKKGKTLSKNIF